MYDGVAELKIFPSVFFTLGRGYRNVPIYCKRIIFLSSYRDAFLVNTLDGKEKFTGDLEI